MTLRLYNTLTKTKEDFHPLDPNNVRMYVCGPTVYDYAHIGNARPAIVFDVLFRLLRHLYGEKHVTYVRNITDVDDKIIKAAQEKNVPIDTITKTTAQQYFDDVAALGCLTPTHQPRATEYIKPMVAMIERLIASGHAYAAEGHALFDVSSKKDYGKLARRSLDEMMAGARVEVAPYKKNPMDFVLWKPSSPDLPGWDSPWGRGRPGWHIECSAMGEALLGETFDIHGGGIDLVFPHHENEIAQSECAHGGHPFARVWMHNGFLQVEGEKMSKSLGNFVTMRQLLRNWKGRAWSGASIRLAMLGVHYRQPADWTHERLQEANEEVVNYTKIWNNLTEQVARRDSPLTFPPPSEKLVQTLSDDLNLPDALAHIRAARSEIFGGGEDGKHIVERSAALISDLMFLGVFNEHTLKMLGAGYRSLSDLPVTLSKNSPEKLRDIVIARSNNDDELAHSLTASFTLVGVNIAFSKTAALLVTPSMPLEDTIEESISARNAARKAKDFKESDRIRDELLAKGIVLKDSPTGTTWEVKR